MTNAVEPESMWIYKTLVFLGLPNFLCEIFAPKISPEGTIGSRTLIANGGEIKYGPGHTKEGN